MRTDRFAPVVRRILVLLLSLVAALTWSVGASRSQDTSGAPQVLFLGDRLCGDVYSPCLFPAVTARHRYLHVILHDYEEDVEWRVRTSPDDCLNDAHDIAGSIPVPASEFLEIVIDLVATADGQPVLNTPACYHFRGLEGYDARYYAAYFDDNPAPDADTLYPGYGEMAGRPYLPDLDVQYIHESPSRAYDATPNTPPVGSLVTYTAHLRNVGALPVSSYDFSWHVDTHVVKKGTVNTPLPPGASATLNVVRRYDGRPHDITLQTVPPGPQISSANDTLSIRSDGLKLGFWVEQSAYRYFQDNQWEYCAIYSCAGNDSLEDWLQHNIRKWNSMLSSAVDRSLAPAGIATRVRVDEITVVPDGFLPLHGGLATNDPDTADHSVDLEWGLPASSVEHAFLRDRDGAFDIDYGMLHELGHARGLTDVYRFDIPVQGADVINVTAADGSKVFDGADPTDPLAKLRAFDNYAGDALLYRNAEHDLMSCVCTPYYSPYNAVVLNRMRGQRARCGNTNPPCNIGDWFLDMPRRSRLQVLGATGRPLPNATVRLFFDSGSSYTGHTFLQSDSQTLTTSGSGVVNLPRDPFRAGGSVDRAAHNDLLIEVQTPHADIVCVQEPTTFNLAYWEGYRDVRHPATFTFRAGRQVNDSCELERPPALVNEPFSTSPSASTVVTIPSGRGTSVQAHLLDDAVHPNPMRNRIVRFYSGKTLLGRSLTDSDGYARITVPGTPHQLRVVDLTDNSLLISPPA